MSENIRENCGVGLVYDIQDAIDATRIALKNRGRDAEGYGTFSNGGINIVRSYWGLMDAQALITLLRYEEGNPIQVHTRYKTKGSSEKKNLLMAAHPHSVGGVDIVHSNHYITVGAQSSMVHNGTVTFDFSQYDIEAKTGCDTEYLLHVHKIYGPEYVLQTIPGSYSVVTMNVGDDFATVYRDRFGRRPLWLGADRKGHYIVMSEDHAIEEIGGKPVREVRPGELLHVYPNYIESYQIIPQQPKLCFFEANYLAQRLSHLWEILRGRGINIAKLRYDLGLELFAEHPPLSGIDFVTHIPKSPIDAAHAYASASGLQRKELFYKVNDNRAFMNPEQDLRTNSIRDTLFVNHEITPSLGANYVSVDDSNVRGTNLPEARKKGEERGFMMRQANFYTPIVGGKENGIDLGCDHGVDMPRSDNFLASRVGRDPRKIANEIGIEYAGFLSIEGLMDVFERNGIGRQYLCLECVRPENFG